jgi:hypothetical protein
LDATVEYGIGCVMDDNKTTDDALEPLSFFSDVFGCLACNVSVDCNSALNKNKMITYQEFKLRTYRVNFKYFHFLIVNKIMKQVTNRVM